MRIITQAEFLKLPGGTLYSKYTPSSFDGLCIKAQTEGDNDFVCMDLVGNIEARDDVDFLTKCDEAVNEGAELKLDFEAYGRDGMFDKEQLFAVYSRKDIFNLIDTLKVLVG